MLKIGHRGAPGNPRYAENTLGSFGRAIWKGATALEFDVRKSKDGKLVVIHDDYIDRTTNGSGTVNTLTYKEIAMLDAGFGEKVPTFEEVLRRFGREVLLNIELKEQGIEDEVLFLVQELQLQNHVLISAFDSDDNDSGSNSSWDQLNVFWGKVPIALLATESKITQMGWAVYLEEAISRNAFAIHPGYASVYPEAVRVAHDRGLLVNVWTANRSSDIQELKKMGVDGIFSDFPELL